MPPSPRCTASRSMSCAPPPRSPISATAGHQEQPDQSATSSPRPTSATHASQGRGPAGKIHPRGHAQDRRGVPRPRSGRLFPHHLGRHVVISLQFLQGKARGCAQEVDRPARPKWKGKVSTGHPAFSGYVGTWVLTMRKLYGWDYFEKLEKNKPQIGRSINDTVTALNSGERQVAAGADGSTLFSAGTRQSAQDRLSQRRLGADHLAVGDREGHQASQRREALHGVSLFHRSLARSTSSTSPRRCGRRSSRARVPGR